MSNNEDKSILLNVLAGIGLGAIVGAAAGLLFAPKSGIETRDDIKKAAEELKVKAESAVGELHTSIDDLLVKSKDLMDSTKTKVQHAVEAGKQAMAEKKEELEETVKDEIEA
ncbi:MAG: YtxH domain-containing protein [Armatimonadota bacterium]